MAFRPQFVVAAILTAGVLSGWAEATPVRDGGETRVNSTTSLDQGEPSVACDRVGNCVVVWYTPGYGSAPTGIFAQRYDREGHPRGGQLQVNAFLPGDRANPAVACDAAGNFVVVWEGETEHENAWEVRGRRFGSDGAPLTGDFEVSTNLEFYQEYPAIGMTPSGGFVVFWMDDSRDEDGSSGLLARRFAANGSPLGAPFTINATTPDTQTDPALAIDSAGGFFAVWTSYQQDGESGGVFGRRFDPSGMPLTGEIQLNTTTAGFQGSPSVVRQDDGTLLATWASEGVDDDGFAIVGRRFDPSGLPLTAEFPINTTTAGYQWTYPASTASTPEGAVVPWTSEGQDGDGGTIVARLVSGAGVPNGAEFQVNTTSAGYQYAARIAANGGGDFLVAWAAPDPATQRYQIWSQRFSNERQMNQFSAGAQAAPTVGINAAGRFLVVWDSFDQDGQWEGVFGRADSSVDAVPGTEFQVNTYTTVGQYQPAISSNTSNGFVVVWSSAYQDGSGYGVFGQRYDAAGARVGDELQVNTTTEGYQETPAVARRAEGDFVVVWSSYGQDGSSYGIVGQRYDSDGAADGGEFLVNTSTPSAQTAPSVAKNQFGDFIVVWESAAGDADGWGIAGRCFDAAGYPIGPEFPVNETTAGDQRRPAVGLDGFGNSVVVWESKPPSAAGGEIVGRRFDARGDPFGAEFPINAVTAGGQSHPALAVDASGRFVAAWETESLGPTGTDVVARQFAPDGTPVGDEFPAHVLSAGEQRHPSVAIDDSGRFAIAWESLEQDGSAAGAYARRFALAETAGPCAPPIVGAPLDRVVCAGDTTTFTVTAGGTGPPVFQWKKDGVPLADGGTVQGAHEPTLRVGPSVPADAGAYEASVTDACAPPHVVTSGAATLAVDAPLPRVGNSLRVNVANGQLHLTWQDIAGGRDYAVYEDTSPSGAFTTPSGTAAGGTAGLTIPLPSEIRYYRVAARNTCGEGTKD